MAQTFSDDFNRAPGTNLGANWTEDSGDASIYSDTVLRVESTSYTQVTATYTGQACDGVDQYVLVEFSGVPTGYPFVYFRRTDAGSPLYGVQLEGNGNAEWYKLNSTAGGSTQIGTTKDLGAPDVSMRVGLTLIGTGSNTVLRAWLEPTGNAPDSGGETWGSAAPTQSWTDDPGANAVDTGNYVGIGGQQSSIGDPGILFTQFYGGDAAAGGGEPENTDRTPTIGAATLAGVASLMNFGNIGTVGTVTLAGVASRMDLGITVPTSL